MIWYEGVVAALPDLGALPALTAYHIPVQGKAASGKSDSQFKPPALS